MKVKDVNIQVTGNFSNIYTRDEYKFLSKEYDRDNHLCYTCKVKRKGNKRFSKIVILGSSSLIFDISKSIYKYNRFLGNITEVEGGFIPCHNLVDYFSKKVYKTFEDAERALIQKRYKDIEKTCFGYLAKRKFDFTINYIQNFSVSQLAKLINEQFGYSVKIATKISKKFLRSDIIDCYGQGGYKTTTQIIY